jgi:predicted 3-demethylubiquinone-9 3-methyltransferase (glyoxalase superfamily)
MSAVTPFIWFKDNAEEAMNYYVSLFPNSKIVEIQRYEGGSGIPGEDKLKGKVLTGIFEVMGMRFMCLDGGDVPGMQLNSSAVSFVVEFDSQDELDKVWDKLLADGAKPQQCGWIVDQFGITWQINPTNLGKMYSDPNATPEQKKAVTQAMLQMVKLDGPKLEEAFNSAK